MFSICRTICPQYVEQVRTIILKKLKNFYDYKKFGYNIIFLTFLVSVPGQFISLY